MFDRRGVMDTNDAIIIVYVHYVLPVGPRKFWTSWCSVAKASLTLRISLAGYGIEFNACDTLLNAVFATSAYLSETRLASSLILPAALSKI